MENNVYRAAHYLYPDFNKLFSVTINPKRFMQTQTKVSGLFT